MVARARSSPIAAPTRDGRAERAERTRAAVADALLSLLDEGRLQPTAPEIAERAGVSLRTVFHHYRDLNRLHATVADRQTRRLLAMIKPVPREGPLAARIDAFTAERSRLLEAIAPVRRAALLHEASSAEIASRLRWTRQRGRREVEVVFARELDARPPADRRELLEALAVASSWSAWEALRTHQALSVAQARRVMARMFRALLKEE